MRNKRLISFLHRSALADREKALMSLDLLADYPAGIGDHSTGDFYANAEEALRLLADAEDRIETLARHYPDQLELGDAHAEPAPIFASQRHEA